MNKENDYVERKLKQRRKKSIGRLARIALLAIVALAILFGGYKLVSGLVGKNASKNDTKSTQNAKETNTKKDTNKTGAASTEKEKPKADEIKEIRVKAVGDILYHTPLLYHGYNVTNGEGYDFTEHYALIKDFMSDADLTIGNFEGTSNPNRKADGYPMFNAPKVLFKTLKDAGFDAVSTINNHSLDTLYEGVGTTIDAIEEAGLKNFGTQKTAEEKYKILDVNGSKIALLGYTDNLNGMDFVLDTDEKKASVNRLDAQTVKADIEKVKKDGADFVIIYPHWGDEYAAKPRPEYVDLARKMIDWGADVVCGNHPHVVEPSEWHETSDGRKGFIIYSIGNFISNQNLETMNNIATEHSLVVEMIFKKNVTKNEGTLEDVKLHPTWVKRTADEYGGYLHQTVLAEEYKKGGKKASKLTENQVKRATKAYDMTMETLKAPVQ